MADSLCLYWLLHRQGRSEYVELGLAALFLSLIIVRIVLALMPDEDDSGSNYSM